MVYGLEKRQRSAIAATSVWLMMMVSLPLLMLILLTPPTTTAFLLSNTDASHDGPHGDNHRVKRFAPPIFTAIDDDDDGADDDDCGLCLLSEDQESCQRCLALGLLVARDYVTDGEEDNMAAAQKRAYEPMRRFQRGSGCSCCYFSRMTNTGCCAACSMTTKRYGKRSGAGAVTSDDAVMTSYRGSDYVVGSVNCQCCALSGEAGCCRRCLAP